MIRSKMLIGNLRRMTRGEFLAEEKLIHTLHRPAVTTDVPTVPEHTEAANRRYQC